MLRTEAPSHSTPWCGRGEAVRLPPYPDCERQLLNRPDSVEEDFHPQGNLSSPKHGREGWIYPLSASSGRAIRTQFGSSNRGVWPKRQPMILGQNGRRNINSFEYDPSPTSANTTKRPELVECGRADFDNPGQLADIGRFAGRGGIVRAECCRVCPLCSQVGRRLSPRQCLHLASKPVRLNARGGRNSDLRRACPKKSARGQSIVLV